ncbi:hypothetical protein PRZ48_004400 [Zasmidium cellare]|uniref:FAD-binding domain-containing protein n=1 Tax=Zasmidium cellare TaxID=395010 RepID=A0ABR0EQG3_ZASCE|nr:hypothetical protein PRZ48_004400 [Zasmidium cellare]
MAANTNGTVEQVPVLIVGGSLVGLTLAALLAKYGIKCMVIEKHSSTAIHPRATLMMPRTMQVFKELGLYEIMKEESLKYYDKKTCIITIESLAGKLLHKWLEDVNEGIERVSATRRVFLTQQALEPLLRAKAKELGAQLRFSTEMVSLTQDSDSVTATLKNRDTNITSTIRSSYLIAADGFRSTTRSLLGIPTQGPGLLSRALTIYFEILDKDRLATLANAHYSGVVYVSNPAVRCFFRFDRDKKESFLVINSAGKQGSEASRFPADTASMESAEGYLRAAIGDEEVKFKIHQLTTWEAIADVPVRLREGRCLLAGDAAHRMPPSGGFGGNTGVQDAHNLAWKLAYVLKGQAGPSLPETYEEERYPIAKHTVENALAHYVHRTEPSLSHLVDEYDVKESPVEHLEMAYRYHSKALFTNGPLNASNITEDPATSVAAPGSVAHHVLVDTADGRKNVAISEFFGDGFVLFVGSNGGPWINAARKLEGTFRTVQLVFDDDKVFARRYSVLQDGAVLVRPDGFVAWSCRSIVREKVQDAQKLLEEVRKRVLCL